MKRRRQRDGYTLIEVMMAVSIMMVGAVGIMSMQAATTRGNNHSRQLSTATEITHLWLERFRTDALSWTAPGAPTATVNLNGIPGDGTFTLWFEPATLLSATETEAAFDFLGRDTTTGAEKYYCVNARIAWVIPNETIRVDVRTWWSRSSRDTGISAANAFADCNGGDVAGVTTELAATVPRLHAVYGSTVVRWNQRQP